MRNIHYSYLVLTLSLLLFACTESKVGSGERPAINVASAEQDAKEAVSRNDLTLLAVRGFSLELPGVVNDSPEFRKEHSIRVMEGTSDAYKDSSDRKYNEDAHAYAERYNRVILNAK